MFKLMRYDIKYTIGLYDIFVLQKTRKCDDNIF